MAGIYYNNKAVSHVYYKDQKVAKVIKTGSSGSNATLFHEYSTNVSTFNLLNARRVWGGYARLPGYGLIANGGYGGTYDGTNSTIANNIVIYSPNGTLLYALGLGTNWNPSGASLPNVCIFGGAHNMTETYVNPLFVELSKQLTRTNLSSAAYCRRATASAGRYAIFAGGMTNPAGNGVNTTTITAYIDNNGGHTFRYLPFAAASTHRDFNITDDLAIIGGFYTSPAWTYGTWAYYINSSLTLTTINFNVGAFSPYTHCRVGDYHILSNETDDPNNSNKPSFWAIDKNGTATLLYTYTRYAIRQHGASLDNFGLIAMGWHWHDLLQVWELSNQLWTWDLSLTRRSTYHPSTDTIFGNGGAMVRVAQDTCLCTGDVGTACLIEVFG